MKVLVLKMQFEVPEGFSVEDGMGFQDRIIDEVMPDEVTFGSCIQSFEFYEEEKADTVRGWEE